MKKALIILLSIFVVLILGISFVRAEDYVSNDFPPENILEKAFKPDGLTVEIKIVGKFKNQDGSYTVYFASRLPLNGKEKNTEVVIAMASHLFKLDTNKWIFVSPDNVTILLQK